MEEHEMKAELPSMLDEVFKKHNSQVLSRLDTWLEHLDAKLDIWRMQIGTPHVRTPMTPRTPRSAREDVEASDLSSSTSAEVHVRFGDTVAEPEQHHLSLTHRSPTPDSYDLAKQVGQSIHDAFAKLGSHSQDLSGLRSGIAHAWNGVQFQVAALVNSQAMGIFWALVILTNSIYLGIQLEWSAHHRTTASNPVFTTVHIVYAALFTVEALMQLIAVGCRAYVFGPSWAWNWLDVFVVTSSWVELIIDLLTPGEVVSRSNSNLRLMRLLRLGRVVRVVRIVRVVRLFRALRTLVYSLLGTLKSLFWSFLLLLLIMYIFGILFTDVVLNYFLEHASDGDLEEYFGSLYLSIRTLFRSISNGVTWGHAADSLEQIGMEWVQVFHLYVAFCSFALLNVMTGVFCNSAIKAAERDHDTVVQTMLQTKKEYRHLVDQLFRQIDTRRLGHVTIHEFEEHFDDQAVRAFFDYLQIGAMDAWTLFVSLDKDGDHTITADEFAERCVQLHGPARSADLYSMKLCQVKVEKQLRRIMDAQARLESHFMVGNSITPTRSSRFTV
ncbi:Sodium channel protein type 11 subunit alpha (NaN) (Sensory neuron sodium channel 2) (Sodium channel protein type XI subunit alpha) (Voltage-gated sodium channel subunit alpha Nav1.9) [Durusdinium trenchii]